MKCLLIENGKGYYALDESNKISLDQLTKEDLLKLLDLVLSSEVEIDPYDENNLQNAAHRIIYRNLCSKLNSLIDNKARFKDESISIYKAAMDKYKVELQKEETKQKTWLATID
ncbi:hypothetical protein I5Q82_06875 [Acutalibacter muris]|uniref:Uncharacterized protein n=1 Tax=Acutalibacter muris TaxID=1796620 RepID=A0A1Z2XUR6_9FIRM|nr:hypothetical protein [Acutalibacter muris]ANU54650.1 hypothetical protein A4V00_11885 [Hungateiclostridiaceae bacterium KB18]ASB42119.1 hypothetical protein ADH66_16485 [Acutalibacter muris]QQR31389.1 hypothetical protein I5Q82_06875 [Acutalibacter muris]